MAQLQFKVYASVFSNDTAMTGVHLSRAEAGEVGQSEGFIRTSLFRGRVPRLADTGGASHSDMPFDASRREVRSPLAV